MNLERVRKLAEDAPPDWCPRGRYFAALGSLTQSKGFDLLIEAHAHTRERSPHELVIMGEGPERQALEDLARQLRVAGTVRLPGFAQNPFPVLAGAVGFCMPSRFEGMPLALIEALSLGTPTIACDCVAGPRQILDGGRFGALLAVEDPASLAATMEDHLRDPAPLAARAKAAQTRLQDFTVEAAARRYVELFREAAEGGGRH